MGKKLILEQRCDCLDKTEKAVLEKVKTDNAKIKGFDIIEDESGFENVSFLPLHTLFANYNVRYVRTKANGKPALPATKKVVLLFTYCPFCGKKMREEG